MMCKVEANLLFIIERKKNSLIGQVLRNTIPVIDIKCINKRKATLWTFFRKLFVVHLNAST